MPLTINSSIVLAAICVAAVPFAAAVHAANNFTSLYSFAGGNADGSDPLADMTLVGSTFYGTTFSGGANGSGAVYSITAAGAEQLVYSFGGAGDGTNPRGTLTAIGNTMYGTTATGGANSAGTVFSIMPNGTEKVLYSFAGGAADGKAPDAGLTLVGNTFYGTTSFGGASGAGTIFSITTDGTEKVLYSFAGGNNDGADPEATLTPVGNMLYGTTQRGGSNISSDALGSVFSYNLTNNTEQVLRFFTGFQGDASRPLSDVTILGSTIYGTTSRGGTNDDGTVFSLNTAGNGFKILHNFTAAGDDGNKPSAGLTAIGPTLFGTTLVGGTNGNGTIFSLGVDGSNFSTLHSFATTDGAGPWADFAKVGSLLYSTTSSGGTNGGFGTVYTLSVPEPSSIVLLACGALAFLAAARRRTSR
jgi:uncharacterized repeat protein (TIGR03803 family)